MLKKKSALTNSNTGLGENIDKAGLEALLAKSRVNLNDIISTSSAPQFIINQDHKIVYWNRALEELSNITADNILGTNKQWKVFYNTRRPCMADFIVNGRLEDIPKWYGTEDGSKFMLKYQGTSESKGLGNSCEAVAFFPRMGKKGKWLHFTAMAIKDFKGDVIGAVQSFEDVTKEIKLQKQLLETLEEKEVLLKEIQHRIKSDLQIIRAMIHFQSYYIDHDPSLELFKEIQNHVNSMTRIHDKLYRSKDLTNINMENFIKSLVIDLFRIHGVDNNRVNVGVNAKVMLNINTAIPCGLMINELVTSSIRRNLQSTSSEDNEGESFRGMDRISVKIIPQGESFLMTVYDNAPVLLESFNLQDKTLSMWFVNKLAAQLGGLVDLKQDNGTLFNITFREMKFEEEF